MSTHSDAPNFSDLAGKTVAITGGGGVLCRSFADAFCRVGARVALLDISLDAAQSAAIELSDASGARVEAIECDVLSIESLDTALDEIRVRLGPLDILVNGAGGNVPAATTQAEQLDATNLAESFYGLGLDGFTRAFDLNFIGTVLPSQRLTADMHQRGSGVIINVSSMNAFKPLTRIPAYSAAKAAVSNFTEWLAVHLAPAGIRVNAIAPGFFLTQQLRYLAYDDQGDLTPRYQKVLAKTAMGRLGDPNELQGTLLYLASNLSSFVTGVVIPVDGGFNASSGV